MLNDDSRKIDTPELPKAEYRDGFILFDDWPEKTTIRVITFASTCEKAL